MARHEESKVSQGWKILGVLILPTRVWAAKSLQLGCIQKPKASRNRPKYRNFYCISEKRAFQVDRKIRDTRWSDARRQRPYSPGGEALLKELKKGSRVLFVLQGFFGVLLWWLLFKTNSSSCDIEQRLASFFSTGPDSKYFQHCGCLGSVGTALPVEHKSSCRHHINEWVWLRSTKISLLKRGNGPDLACAAVCQPLV